MFRSFIDFKKTNINHLPSLPNSNPTSTGKRYTSELDNIIPPEIKGDEFYYIIKQIAQEANVKTVLEIGSSAGAGSTEAFVSGLSKNRCNPVLFCMEISRPRFNELQKRYEKQKFVKCYNVSSVTLEEFSSEEDVTHFYKNTISALNEYPLDRVLGWLRQDIDYVKNSSYHDSGIQKIKKENNITNFDMVLIDGSEFTGESELNLVYGAKIIMLDDINGYKNYHNYLRLSNDADYTLIAENKNLRNGYAIFKRNCEKLPIHFYTIVLNGEPYIRYHIDVLKQLPFNWHWHIVEGVADLNHDTSWSMKFGGRITDELHRNGQSHDGTTDYLNDLAEQFPNNITVYRKPSGVFWDGKLEMVNAPLANITESCLLWQIDADEIWTLEQICAVRHMFLKKPSKSAAYYFCNYFVGENLVTTTRDTYGNNTSYEWLRTWRFEPGDSWMSHEPPILCKKMPNGSWVDIAKINPFLHSETEAERIIFQHFAYATEQQVRFKEVYFGYKGAVEQWKLLQKRQDFPVYLRDYFSWVKDDTQVDVVDTQNLRCYSTLFNKKDQKIKSIKKSIEKSKNPQTNKGDQAKGYVLDASMISLEKDRFHQKKINRKKILVVSHERSGTHFLINAIALNFPYYSNNELSLIGDSHELKNIFEAYYSIEENRIFKSHHQFYFYSHFFSELVQNFHVFYVIRDGRDVLNSCFHYFNQHPDVFPASKDIEEFLELNGYTGYSQRYSKNMAERWALHIKSWLSVKDQISFVKYEDLKLRFKETIVDIANVLMIDTPEEVVIPTLKDRSIDPRKGIIGDWKDHFTANDLVSFDNSASKCMKELGYYQSFNSVPLNPNKIIWVRTDSIGDNVLAGSTLTAIRGEYLYAQIIVICQEHIVPLYERCPFVDVIISFNKSRAIRDEPYRNKIIQNIMEFNADIALNSVYSREILTDIFAIESGAQTTIAFNGNLCNISAEVRDKHNQFYTQLLTSEEKQKTELRRHIDFLKSVGINISSLQPTIWTSREDEKFADEFFEKNDLNPDKTIALYAGAQNTVRYYDHYGKALSRSIKGRGFTVIALGSSSEYSINQENIDSIGERVINLSGKTTILQSAALLRRCRLSVGAETGLAHISCAVGTPNVILLGGGHFGRFMPYSSLTSVVCLPLDCYGCNWQCHFSHPRCVQDVKPRTISDAICQALNKRSDKIRIYLEADSQWNPQKNYPDLMLLFKPLDINDVDFIPVGRVQPKEKVKVLNQLGESLSTKGDLKGSIEAFENALDIDINNAKSHNNLGVLYYNQGDKEKAYDHYKKAAELQPENITFQKNLADFHYVEQGRIEEAMQIYVKVLNLDPEDIEILLVLAHICVTLENFEDAKYFYNRILGIEPGNKDAKESIDKLEKCLLSVADDLTDQTNIKKSKDGYLVSAIVSTYNAEKYFKGCIEDLESQTIADEMEIIVVNSGSQQNEEAVIRELQEKYSNIKYIKTDQRETVYAAWNRGIKAATGKYITNANTDDRHRQDAFEVMVNTLEAHPEIALVYADVIITETENETFESCTPVGYFNWLDFSREELLNKGCFVGPQPMWRRSVHDEYGYFDDSFITSGDYEFWLRISQSHLFMHLPVQLGLYLRSQDSIEHSNREKQKEENQKILNMYIKARSHGKIIRSIQASSSPGHSEPGGEKTKSPETIYRSIQAEMGNKQPEETIEELEKLAAAFPKFALAFNDLGVLYYNANDNEKSLKFYETAVQLDPGNMIFQKNLADFYYAEMGRVEDAWQIYVKILEANPEDVETLLITGHICVALQKFQDAKEFYSRVLEIESGHQDALQYLDKLNAMKKGDSGIQTPDGLYCEIQPLLNNGDPRRAISALERLLEKFPDCAIAYNDLGVLCYHTGNKEKAQQHYEHAVELMPDNINFQKNLADFYCIELGRIEDALKIYVSILNTNPQDIETLMATAQICLTLEQPDDGRDFFNKVLEIEPWNEAARQHVEELERLPLKAVLINSECPDEIYQRLKQKLSTLSQAEAIDKFENLLGSYPDFALGHNDLGVLYYHNGDKEKTLQHYRQAAQLQPENLTFQKNLAEFLFVEFGKIEDALHIYVNILGLNPHDVEILLITGHICVALKKFDDAKDFYHRVLELDPGNEDAGNNLRELDQHQFGNDLSPSESANTFSALTDKIDSDDLEPDRSPVGQRAATVSIIIGLDGIQNRVKECIKSVRDHTSDPHEILLINRGATKGILKWAQQLLNDNENYYIIECAGQQGRAEFINKAIQKAGGEMVVLLHTDVVVPEGWLKAFKMCIDLVPNIGVVGPMSNRAAGIQQMIHSDESDRIEFESVAKTFYEKNQYRRVTTRKLSDFCLAFRRELPDKIGYFDEQFVVEEIVVEDFCNRAASGGYQNLIAADTYVHHFDRHPGKKNASTKNSTHAEDLKKYNEKWNSNQNPEVQAFQTVQLLERAVESSQRGQTDTAVETVLGAIGLQPENQRLYLVLSEILLTAKRFLDAKDALTEMPSGDDNQEMRKAELLGYAEEGLENFEAAQVHIVQVLAMNPDCAQALNLKGILAYRNDDCGSAEKYFKRTIDADPGYGESYTNLGMLQLEAENQVEALKSFEKGFRLTPTDLDIATNYHALVAGISEYEKAENIAREAVFLYPNNQKIKYMLIDFLVQQGKYELAMPEIEDAIIKFGINDGILSAALKIREKLGPNQISDAQRRTAVSLCMIVKDEEQYLAHCLASVKPIVDEMIIVDTGSTDSTKDIAVSFGAKVYDYDWNHNFAEARNFSISKASGSWILIMDADEVFSHLDYLKFEEIVKVPPKNPAAFSIITRNYCTLANTIGWVANDGKYSQEEAGIGWIPSVKVRLFYGKDLIWFEGVVHELLDPVLKRKGIKIEQCGIPVHHYGRLNKGNLDRKGEIYFEIGKKKLEEMGDDLNALRELAIQATILEKDEDAIELWERLLALKPEPKLSSEVFINMGTVYSRMGKYQEALYASKNAIEYSPGLKEAIYNYSMAELHLGNADKTIEVLEEMLTKISDYPPAQFILVAAYSCQGKKERALEGLKKLKSTQMGSALVYSCVELSKGLISADQIDYAISLLGAAIDSEIVNADLLNLFKECLNIKENTDTFGDINTQLSMPTKSVERFKNAY